MKVLALIAYAAVVASMTLVPTADASDMSTPHLRVLTEDGTACTITKESQCDGQNWTGSTCCEDPNYECRWSDNNQDVKRCQLKIDNGGDYGGNSGGNSTTPSSTPCTTPITSTSPDMSCTITKESQCDGQNWTGSTCCEDPNYECRWSDNNQDVKRCQKKLGV